MTDQSQFLNPDFKTSKYFPIDENLEEKTEEVQEAWKSIFAFAFSANQSGRKFTDTDIVNLTAQYCVVIHGLSQDKVRAVFEKVRDNNKEEFGISSKPEIVKVEVFLRKNWDFVRNEITQSTEFKKKDSKKWETINTDSIYRKLQSVGFKFGHDKLKSLVKSDFVPSYHPFKDYFENLDPWDGITDYIEELSKFVNTTENDFFRTQFKKALVRSIGCSVYEKENRIVMTFVQEKQSTGKSTFIRFLNPFGTKYYTEAPIRGNKDSEFAFAENFIYNLEELASANNVDVNRLKAIISAATIKERKAYEVNPIDQPRRCNFWASTNKVEFLVDSENTRWLCFLVNSIDWGYKETIDIHKVWAQAYALYHDKSFNDQLTNDEAKIRDENNKSYEINDLEKELIKKAFKVCWKNEGKFYSNADITQILSEMTKQKIESKYIPKNMIQLGFSRDMKKINGHTTRGYWAIYVEPTQREDYENNNNEIIF